MAVGVASVGGGAGSVAGGALDDGGVDPVAFWPGLNPLEILVIPCRHLEVKSVFDEATQVALPAQRSSMPSR